MEMTMVGEGYDSVTLNQISSDPGVTGDLYLYGTQPGENGKTKR